MKALILGINGQLGQALAVPRPDGTDLVGYDLPDLDITDADSLSSIVREVEPDIIINAAAYTAVDKAESEPELALAVNVDGPRNIVVAAKGVGASLIHISTDFVFDGEASVAYGPIAATNPLSVYGRTKRDGELAVLEPMPDQTVVLRTAWLYSKTGGNFVKTILRLMAERDELNVVADQRGTPTWANSLAEAVWRFATTPDLTGIYHWTDGGEATWYEFAVAIQEEALALGLLERPIPIHPITTDDYPTPARRPRYSILNCSATVRDLDLPQVPWRKNLRCMLEGMKT